MHPPWLRHIPFPQAFVAAALGIALQVQITVMRSETYTGLRLCLADLLLPIFGLVIAALLFSGKARWPDWKISRGYYWLAGLTALLVFSFFNGYFTTGEWSQWALTNKVLGWFVLLAYLGLGAWITANLGPEFHKLFLITFFLFFAAAMTVQTAIMYMQDIKILEPQIFMTFPLEAFMANRNAYAFLIICAAGMVTVLTYGKDGFLPKFLLPLIWVQLPLHMLYVGSRTGIIAMGVVFVVLSLIYRKQAWKSLLLYALIGVFAIAMTYADRPKKLHVFKWKQTESIVLLTDIAKGADVGRVQKNIKHEGDNNRLSVILAAWDLIKKNPVLGSGLGSVLHHQVEKYGHVVDIIDNTPLWLLTETGALGLMVFSAFYLLSVIALARDNRNHSDFHASLCGAVLALIAGFTMMCVFHEILYTRFVWFFLGLSLAAPLERVAGNKVTH